MIFMGQSNMAGRGVADEAPTLIKGAGYEYRAISAPGHLCEITEPFGVDENNNEGVFEPGMKTGSMVTAFVNAFYEKTGVPVVAVSCSKGGSSILEWMPDTAYYKDACKRFNSAKAWLMEKAYEITDSSMVWCQGCTDGDNHLNPGEYLEKTRIFLKAFMQETEVNQVFLIQIGNHRDDDKIYVPIQKAQEALCAKEEKVCLVSTCFKTFAKSGLMKDSFHYTQEGYNAAGTEAGENAARVILKKNSESC